MDQEGNRFGDCGATESNGKLLKAFEDWLLERTRKIYALKAKERCPGEEVCTTDRLRGPCAKWGKTLEQYCKPNQCTLYYTKPNTTPEKFRGFLEATFVWRARHKGGLKLLDGPFWAEKAYMIGNSVFAQAEAELNDADPQDEGYIGFTESSDSDAFKLMRANLLEMRGKK